jgi:FMN phosphatase YigB (HAD superfamily)
MGNIKAIIFDWGDTVMRVFNEKGPMFQWKQVEWIPSMERALKLVAHRFLCCIATGAKDSDTQMMIKALERLGADEYFHAFFSEKDLNIPKPDPDFFRTICKKIKHKPEEVVMVGNSYERDIEPAKSIGMKTLFFNEKKLPGDYPDADQVITCMNQLVVMIDCMDRGGN